MKKFFNEKKLHPNFILSEACTNCGLQIAQMVYARLFEPTKGASAETFVASVAAIAGESAARASLDNPVATRGLAPDRALSFLESLSDILIEQAKDKEISIKFPDFDSLVKQSTEWGGVFLTNDPYYDPHQRPICAAATLRGDVDHLAKQHNLDAWGKASAAAFAVLWATDMAVSTTPPDVVYRLALESSIGVAQSVPISREDAEMIDGFSALLNPTRASMRASDELVGLILPTSAESAQGSADNADAYIRQGILSAIGIAGVLTGEMALRAGVGDASLKQPGSFMRAEADAFLGEGYTQLVAAAGHPDERAEKLSRFNIYLAHAVKSFGSDPYPSLTLVPSDQPRVWLPYFAAIIRDDVINVGNKYKLDDWELASACLVAGLKIINMDNRGVVPCTTAVRLFMEEAVGMAHVGPPDLDALQKAAPPNIRGSMQDIRTRVRSKLKGAEGPC